MYRMLVFPFQSQYKFVCEAIVRVYEEKLVKPLEDYQRWQPSACDESSAAASPAPTQPSSPTAGWQETLVDK